MGITVECFDLDGYCPTKTELFIICANDGRGRTLLEDFNTRAGQEYKPSISNEIVNNGTKLESKVYRKSTNISLLLHFHSQY